MQLAARSSNGKLNTEVRDLFLGALEARASDLHLVSGCLPTLRIDGQIVDYPGAKVLTSEQIESMIQGLLDERQIRNLGELRELDFTVIDPVAGRFRCAIFYEKGQLSVAFRVVPERLPDPEELGLPSAFVALARRRDGLILVTGPVGSGKSTTMNSLIHVINQERMARIITIEDPVEYVHKHCRSRIIQREVGRDTRSFNGALVAAMRQDPNVICVGEMRDFDTVSTALTAAETGHLVISTLHTGSTIKSIERIIDVFPPHQQNQARSQLASSLRGILCQKLLRRSDDSGRVLACELMINTAAICNLIRDAKISQLPNYLVSGQVNGMVTMDQSIRNLYEAGEISLEVALTHSEHWAPAEAA